MAERYYLGEFELLVMLTIIRLGEAAYGVPISQEIEQQTGRTVAFGTVYSTLERLERKASSVPALAMRRRNEAGGPSDTSTRPPPACERFGKQSRA